MKRNKVKSQKEPTIALINVVFLMLIFFLIAGTVAPQLDPELTLIDTRDLDLAAPPDGLVVFPDGRLSSGGLDVASAAAFASGLTDEQRETVRLIPDHVLPAKVLLETAAALRSADVTTVVIATQRVVE